MAVTLTIQGIDYSYPTSGEAPNWAEGATDTIVALVDAINGSIATGDLLVTQSSIANNQTTFANVSGLRFDPTIVRAAFIEYSVNRSTSTNEVDEAGLFQIIYNTLSTSWEITQAFTGDAGMTFEITALGQFRYKSSNLAGASYQGKMKFRARALSV